MTRKRSDDQRMKALVRAGSALTPVPPRAEAKVLARIRELTAARPRRSLFTLMRYSPALTFAALAVFLLPLLALLGAPLFLAGPERVPLVAVSDKGGSVAGRPDKLRPGESLAEKDVIRTGPGEQTALERKGLLALQVFSDSELEIVSFSDVRRELRVRLRAGSIYVRKTDAPSVVHVAVTEYLLTLTGTRVYVSVDAEKTIGIICYEGLVGVSQAGKDQGKILFSLQAGESAGIDADGTWKKRDASGLSDEEKRLDDTLKETPPRDQFITEISIRSSPAMLPRPETDAGEVIPPYTVTAIGRIAPKAATAGEILFYGSVQAGGRQFLVNQEGVFTLDEAGITRRPDLNAGAALRVKPAAAENYLVLSVPGSLILVDAAGVKKVAALPLPKDGTIDHHFLPRAGNGRLFIPVQNHGYYALDLASVPAAEPKGLVLIVKEPFPIAPLVIGETLYIGSYYNNYFGAVNAKGESVFKTTLKGSSFVNVVAAGGSVYLYQAESSGFFILKLDERGRETGRYRIEAAVTADVAFSGGRICGCYADGRIFILDTRTGKADAPGRMFTRGLTTRQWRNSGFGLAGNFMYAPTDRGSILVVDIGRAEVEDEIYVDPKEAFYTAPFFWKGVLHAVANSGNVYRIVRNAR